MIVNDFVKLILFFYQSIKDIVGNHVCNGDIMDMVGLIRSIYCQLVFDLLISCRICVACSSLSKDNGWRSESSSIQASFNRKVD